MVQRRLVLTHLLEALMAMVTAALPLHLRLLVLP